MLRGNEVSRIEGFSDAVLGFTVTLLVVFPAFAATFALICWIWYEHHLFFRRYDLEDGFTAHCCTGTRGGSVNGSASIPWSYLTRGPACGAT